MMIKNKYIYALMALSILSFVGCEDLDTLPEGSTQTTDQIADVVANDPDKAAANVNAIFATFSSRMPNETALGYENHIDIGYPTVMLCLDHNGYDLVASDVGYNWNSDNMDYTDRLATSVGTQMIWNDMYATILASNDVIGAIDIETTDPTSKYYLAQGLASRAFSYWVLAQIYQFNYADHMDAACVPIITPENQEDAALNGTARSTVSEVYTLIMSDLDNAIAFLTSAEEEGISRDDKRYINLAVAYGLRARVNLTMEQWSNAAADASSAIEISTATPADISTVSSPYFSNVTDGNWMWGIIVAETDGVVTSGIVNWISHMGSLNYGYANFSGGKQINKALYNSIPSTDVRKGWWLNEGKASENLNTEEAEAIDGYGYVAYTQVKFAPYLYEVSTATNANDIPLMRIEEMYLIKAEAEAMSGADGKSTLESFVTSYRNPDYTCSGSSAEEVQEEVFNQRRIELWGEGLNWFDIMRLNKDVDRRGAGYPEASNVFNIAAGSDILLWRIPEAEIEANPALSTLDNNPSASVPEPVTDID